MKKTLSLLLVLMLAFCMALPAFAADALTGRREVPQDITLTVPQKYAIKVVNGHAEDGAGNTITTAAAGDTVTVKANTYAGHHFVQWQSPTAGVTYADPKQADTTFVMPACDVTAEAAFQPDPKPQRPGPEPQKPQPGTAPAPTAAPAAPAPSPVPVPVTGDETRLMLPIVLAVLAFIGVVVVVILKKRRK